MGSSVQLAPRFAAKIPVSSENVDYAAVAEAFKTGKPAAAVVLTDGDSFVTTEQDLVEVVREIKAEAKARREQNPLKLLGVVFEKVTQSLNSGKVATEAEIQKIQEDFYKLGELSCEPSSKFSQFNLYDSLANQPNLSQEAGLNYIPKRSLKALEAGPSEFRFPGDIIITSEATEVNVKKLQARLSKVEPGL